MLFAQRIPHSMWLWPGQIVCSSSINWIATIRPYVDRLRIHLAYSRRTSCVRSEISLNNRNALHFDRKLRPKQVALLAGGNKSSGWLTWCFCVLAVMRLTLCTFRIECYAYAACELTASQLRSMRSTLWAANVAQRCRSHDGRRTGCDSDRK